MGHWGWRALIVASVISVWVAGCNLIGDSTVSIAPTSSPAITLTIGRAADRASPSPPAPAATLAAITPMMPSAQATIATDDPALLQFGTATPVPLVVEMPICSERPGGGVSCLGRIGNNLPFAVDRVVVDVGLIRGDGARILESAAIEQGMIPSNAYAPYRVLFDAGWGDYSGITVSLQSADLAAADTPLVALPVEDSQVELDGNNARVTGVIVNAGADDVQLSRAVVTLVDADGHVLAYRVISLNEESLPAGGETPLNMTLILPDLEAGTLPQPSIYIEGLRQREN